MGAVDDVGWAPRPVSDVPTAVLLSTTPGVTVRRYAEREHHLVRWTETDRDGHFIALEALEALEAPDAWLDNVRAFFADLRR